MRRSKKICYSAVCSTALLLASFALVHLLHAKDTLATPFEPIIGRFDPQLGWSLSPMARSVSHGTGSKVVYQINSKGLRDRETPYEKPDDVFRILLIGDSRVFGFGVPMEKHFGRVIEGYFANVEVINMGVSGYGVGQELLFLRSEGFRYQPDLVIAYVAHFWAHRHMHTERFGKKKPMYRLRNGVLEAIGLPVSAPDGSPSQVADQVAQTAADNADWEDPAFRERLFTLGNAIVVAMAEEAHAHDARFVLVTQMERLHDAAQERGIMSLDASEPMGNPAFPLPRNLQHFNECGSGVLGYLIAEFLKDRDLVPYAPA